MHTRNKCPPPVLLELAVGCRQQPQQVSEGLVRYRITSKVIKGAPHGGLPDEWVVTKDVFDAVTIAEQLLDQPEQGTLLLAPCTFCVIYSHFRAWVNSPAGQRLGLAPIPPGRVNLRMLRRTLAVELAYRPGGLLAAKVHLKHVSVVTTEGYAIKPARRRPIPVPRRGRRGRAGTQPGHPAGRVPQLPQQHHALRARRP